MEKSCLKKMNDCDCDEWEMVRYEESEFGGNVISEVWLDEVLNYVNENEVSSVAVVCRKFRRIADRHDSWRIRVLRDGIRVEAARVDEKQKSAMVEEGGKEETKYEKDDFRIISRTSESVVGELPAHAYKKIFVASKIASSRSADSANAYLKSLSGIVSTDLKDAALKITLLSGTFLLIAPVCVNGAVGMLFCTWQQGWVMWAIRTTVAEYGWASACTAGAFVLRNMDKRKHPASRVLQAGMAAVAGYLSHLAFVALI